MIRSEILSRPLHFCGIAGTGMSGLALYQLGRGGRVSGSDRQFDRGQGAAIRAALEAAGARIHPQDGSGFEAGTVVVTSTAIEESHPEIRRARELGLTLLHRSELLAEISLAARTIAVSGTSGKSTVTAMVFRILREAGLDPSVVSGGVLVELQDQGAWGNAWGGRGDLLVIEADESDGTLVRYQPEVGVLLNIDRDHKELSELDGIFRTFRANTRGPFVVHGDRPDCVDIGGPGALRFGVENSSHPRPEDLVLGAEGSTFRLGDVRFEIPWPGLYQVENALAAAMSALAVGVDLAVSARALRTYRGVGRRFQTVGTARGVRVIDDFAHNPAKVAAAIAAARPAAHRLLLVFQPHGYGPTRFLFDDFAASFAAAMSESDHLWLAPIYDAGGTADRSISSQDLAAAISAQGRTVHAPAARSEIPALIAAAARPGDLVLLMGARDPELPAFARDLLAALG